MASPQATYQTAAPTSYGAATAMQQPAQYFQARGAIVVFRGYYRADRGGASY